MIEREREGEREEMPFWKFDWNNLQQNEWIKCAAIFLNLLLQMVYLKLKLKEDQLNYIYIHIW